MRGTLHSEVKVKVKVKVNVVKVGGSGVCIR